jgi:hypothetical protein
MNKKRRYSPVELTLGVIFPLLAIVVFNAFPHWLIAGERPADSRVLIAVLDPAFAVHIPWLTAVWGMEIALRLVVLAQRRWTAGLRWAEYIVSLASLAVTFRIFLSDPLTINGGLDIIVRFALGIALLAGAISAVVKPIQLVLSSAGEEEALSRPG